MRDMFRRRARDNAIGAPAFCYLQLATGHTPPCLGKHASMPSAIFTCSYGAAIASFGLTIPPAPGFADANTARGNAYLCMRAGAGEQQRHAAAQVRVIMTKHGKVEQALTTTFGASASNDGVGLVYRLRALTLFVASLNGSARYARMREHLAARILACISPAL